MDCVYKLFVLWFVIGCSAINDFEPPGPKPLILTEYIEKGETDKARELCQVDSSLFLGVESYSGFLTVNKTLKNNLFFWYFPARNSSLEALKDTPLIIWLQGGPGVSSLYGLFTEIGPWFVKDGKLQKRNVDWDKYSLLFIDNPVGAGFSYTGKTNAGYVKNEVEVGEQLLSAVQQFLVLFGELRKAPLFIAGESYAGKYIPALGYQIHKHKTEFHINLRGLLIGNGWIDPPTLLHYDEFGHEIGLLGNAEAKRIKDNEEKVAFLMANKQWSLASWKKNVALRFFERASGVSFYNYLKNEGDDSLDKEEFVSFISQEHIRKALHAGDVTFDVIDTYAYVKLQDDVMQSVKPWLEELLEHYAVMCYNGQLDVIVAYALSVHTYDSLRWSAAEEYRQNTRSKIINATTGNVLGYSKQGGNFWDVLVRNAGHMVPSDQPEVALYIYDKFINKYKK